jgi:hypothetical protein
MIDRRLMLRSASTPETGRSARIRDLTWRVLSLFDAPALKVALKKKKPQTGFVLFLKNTCSELLIDFFSSLR